MKTKHTIFPNESIRIALEKISVSGKKCISVINRSNKLIGTLSDGDLRRAILNKKKLNEKIFKIYNRNPFFLFDKKYSTNYLKNKFIKNQLDIIPIVNKQKKYLKTLFITDIFNENKIFKKIENVTPIIMAGGKGTRLKPFTNILPKPLIPVKGATAIEKILNNFRLYGLNNFNISIHEKFELIKAFFNQLNPSYKVNFIEEDKPLGTIGCLNLIDKKKLKKNLLVTNCDIITNFDLYDFYKFHEKKRFDITIVVANNRYDVPYGVCKISKYGKLIRIDEKPTFDFMINIGIYLLNKKILKLIPKKKYDINDLINLAKKKGYKVGAFPVSEESWNDVGQWSEFYNLEKKLFNY